MIRSTKCSLKFANLGKREQFVSFIDEYRRVSQLVIDQLWDRKQLPKFANTKTDFRVETWLGSTSLQAVAKQAIGIRGKCFRCVACGHVQDADANAGINIAHLGCGEAAIVPHVKKSLNTECYN